MNIYTLAEDLGILLQECQLSMVTTESCTGGWISQAITSVAGSSNWFLQGWVTYSNQSKIQELGVPSELIIKYGAVSQQVVIAMVEGAINKSGANIAVATSGVAGPGGGSEYNPVGTVWMAININRKIYTEKLILSGDRQSIREQTVIIVLNKIIELVRGKCG